MSTNNSARLQLFLMVQGINSQLTAEQAAANQGMGQVPTYWGSKNGVPGIVPFLQQAQFPDAFFLVYSYSGSQNGHPLPYDCTKTFSNPLSADIVALNGQITNFLRSFRGAPTDVYIIGHSLGGVVAFGYLAYLKKEGALNGSIPNTPQARLKGVVTLDSPIGGVTNNKIYKEIIKHIVERPGICPTVDDNLTSVDNLQQIFLTHQNGSPQGAEADLSQALFQYPAGSNQALAQQAAVVGIPVLTIGNTNDLLWDPNICGLDGDFRTTQWIEDRAGRLAVYGRDFTAGELTCCQDYFLPNHEAVLNDPMVEAGLNQFFPSGGEPTALAVAPPDLPTALATGALDL